MSQPPLLHFGHIYGQKRQKFYYHRLQTFPPVPHFMLPSTFKSLLDFKTANGGAAFIRATDIHPLHTLVIVSPCCRKGRPVVSSISLSAFTLSISSSGYFKDFFFAHLRFSIIKRRKKKLSSKFTWKCVISSCNLKALVQCFT